MTIKDIPIFPNIAFYWLLIIQDCFQFTKVWHWQWLVTILCAGSNKSWYYTALGDLEAHKTYIVGFPKIHTVKYVCIFRFIESSGVKILERNLFRNLVAHLSSLERMEIIGSDTVLRHFNYLFIETSVSNVQLFNAKCQILIKLELKYNWDVSRATLQLQKLMRNIHFEALNNNWRIMFRMGFDK